MKQSISILLILIAFSCKEKEETFIAKDVLAWNHEIAKSKTINGHIDSIPPPPIPPITEYYAKDNFIIDEEGVIYFFQQNKVRNGDCMPDFDYNRKPHFIGLQPSDIKIVPNKDISAFLQDNVKPSEFGGNFIFFSSARDTFQSAQLTQIMRLLEHDTSQQYSWFIRTMTEEEKIVLEHKNSGDHYDATKILWDTNKIDIKPSGK